MKKLITAALIAAFLPAVSHAATLQFPSDEPVASITIPDSWGPKETEDGIEANAGDDAIYLSIDVTDEEGTKEVVDACVEYLKTSGVTVDLATQKESSGELNGMQATSLDWDGTDNDGPVSISLTFLSPKPGKILVITYWGTKGMQEQHGPELQAMITSLKAAE
ncbi:histidine kinase [Pararhizobium sp. BT-229]|uniref:histidine kinase n=1 Tax=Pararhizobium sp. BT-229 TaxID=2986923 RepID=UPI0021F785B4|nr:histidine kinase [Pararhizobium sp. BT-229]MCV9963363.1 histidine kinase [Pararhizobium sp. BT-229]